jgi:antitoxin (DNA-binding transcriptional repressor) of toxin-antitoxin stability system
MCYMRKKITLRELHLQTSDIIKQVADGETFVIERRGVPVAEIGPSTRQGPTTRLPNRERFLSALPRVKTDSGRILEQDRT